MVREDIPIRIDEESAADNPVGKAHPALDAYTAVDPDGYSGIDNSGQVIPQAARFFRPCRVEEVRVAFIPLSTGVLPQKLELIRRQPALLKSGIRPGIGRYPSFGFEEPFKELQQKIAVPRRRSCQLKTGEISGAAEGQGPFPLLVFHGSMVESIQESTDLKLVCLDFRFPNESPAPENIEGFQRSNRILRRKVSFESVQRQFLQGRKLSGWWLSCTTGNEERRKYYQDYMYKCE